MGTFFFNFDAWGNFWSPIFGWNPAVFVDPFYWIFGGDIDHGLVLATWFHWTIFWNCPLNNIEPFPEDSGVSSKNFPPKCPFRLAISQPSLISEAASAAPGTPAPAAAAASAEQAAWVIREKLEVWYDFLWYFIHFYPLEMAIGIELCNYMIVESKKKEPYQEK